jgi:hypothetical protein
MEQGLSSGTLGDRLLHQFIEWVLRRGCAVLSPSAADVALRGGHRFVQLHQRVDADVGVGQFGGVGVPQPVDEGAAGALAVQAGFLEGAQHPVLQCASGDAFTVATDEWGSRGRPGRQSGGGSTAFGAAGEAGGTRIEIAVEDIDERLLLPDEPAALELVVVFLMVGVMVVSR